MSTKSFSGAAKDLTQFSADVYSSMDDTKKMVGISGNDGGIDIPIETLREILAWAEKQIKGLIYDKK